MAEGGHEHPQRGGVQQPVGRRPSDGPPGQGPVLQQHGEPVGQMFHEGGGPVGVEEPDPCRHAADDPAGPLLAAGEQIEEEAEEPEQHHADRRGHDDQDGCRLGLAALVAGGDMEPVGHEERHQRAPEHHVQDDGGTDPLGAEGEAGVRAADTRLGEKPVAQRRPRGGATGGDVRQGERRHVDPEQAEAVGAVAREYGVGELGIGRQCPDLEEHTERQVGQVDVGQRVDLGPVAGQQRESDVEDEQEDEDGADTEADLAPDERPSVPPPVMWRRRHRFLLDRHPLHVGTTGPLGPDMLALCQTRSTTTARDVGTRRCMLQTRSRP